MDENKLEQTAEQIVLPELPKPPEQPEQPEEGFVPYVAEVSGKARGKGLKYKLIPVLCVLTVAGILVTVIGRKHNFYQKTISELHFDYQDGETVLDTVDESYESCAVALSRKLHGRQVRSNVIRYEFNADQKLSNTLTQLDYSYNANEIQTTVKQGTASWFGGQEETLRYTAANGYERAKGDEWVADENAFIPPLYTYLYSVGETGGATFEWYQSVNTSINGKPYLCEIWLMSQTSDDTPLYLTLYRYYQDGKLCGVRVLNNIDTQMQVYDVQSYSIS